MNALTSDFHKQDALLRPVLLIEDSPIDVDLTRRAFARRNMANPVLVARDGDEALAWLPRWESGGTQPLVILLDIHLPKVSGLEVLRELKSHSVSHAIPVVILTTSTEESDIRTAYKLGANSYIVKPVSFERFVEVATQIELYWCATNKTVA